MYTCRRCTARYNGINQHMVSNNRIKTWTLIAHFLILVGGGHGAWLLGMMGIFLFALFKNDSTYLISPEGILMLSSGFCCLAGQIVFTVSFLSKHAKMIRLVHIVGLLLLWLSLLFFGYNTVVNRGYSLVLLTVIPFLACTVVTFTGEHLKRFYWWVWDRL